MEKAIILQGTYLGKDPGPLGQKMMTGFLKMLGKKTWKPKAIFFMGEAVRLLTNEFSVVEFLRILEEQGTDLLACRAAAEDLDISSKLQVGKISSTGYLIDLMSKYEIITL